METSLKGINTYLFNENSIVYKKLVKLLARWFEINIPCLNNFFQL